MKWRFCQWFGLCLGMLVAVAPCGSVPFKASWRPRRLAVGTTRPDGWPTTAKLGDLRAVSNDRLLFVSEFTGRPDYFSVLETNGRSHKIKVSGLYAGADAQFISGQKAIAWGTALNGRGEYYQINGLILDFQRKRPLKWLQEGPATFSNGSVGASRGKDSVLIVNSFSALEWSLHSGRLIHQWRLRQFKKDDDYTDTDTVYAPRTDTFVQIIAGRIRVWSAKTGKIIRTSPRSLPHFKGDYGEGDPPSAVEFSPDADLIAYDAGADAPLRVAQCNTGQVLWYIPAQELIDTNQSLVECVHFSPNGRELYFYSLKKHRFVVFAARTGRLLRSLPAPPGVDQFWVSPDGNSLCSERAGTIWWQRAR